MRRSTEARRACACSAFHLSISMPYLLWPSSLAHVASLSHLANSARALKVFERTEGSLTWAAGRRHDAQLSLQLRCGTRADTAILYSHICAGSSPAFAAYSPARSLAASYSHRTRCLSLRAACISCGVPLVGLGGILICVQCSAGSVAGGAAGPAASAMLADSGVLRWSLPCCDVLASPLLAAALGLLDDPPPAPLPPALALPLPFALL